MNFWKIKKETRITNSRIPTPYQIDEIEEREANELVRHHFG
jgi:hypothetical protein